MAKKAEKTETVEHDYIQDLIHVIEKFDLKTLNPELADAVNQLMELSYARSVLLDKYGAMVDAMIDEKKKMQGK